MISLHRVHEHVQWSAKVPFLCRPWMQKCAAEFPSRVVEILLFLSQALDLSLCCMAVDARNWRHLSPPSDGEAQVGQTVSRHCKSDLQLSTILMTRGTSERSLLGYQIMVSTTVLRVSCWSGTSLGQALQRQSDRSSMSYIFATPTGRSGR